MTQLDLYEQNTKQWLCTTASQIFFMQLGFLCYEVGFVQPVWTQSVILKNIEDTFVGILTFLAFGYTLSTSSDSFLGIIAKPVNPLLIGIDSEYHDKILISAFFASTCATIMSGAILERMKNQAYVCWCMLIILINYSFISHWVWHPNGWLNELGFVDGAGSVVVHSTAGMAALIAVWKLGPRKDSLDKDGKLLPTQHASRPVINAIGAMFLWYGWFAFNVSSPIAFSKGEISIGTTALVTVISPIAACLSAFIIMKLGFVALKFESLLNNLLAGLVAITGMCHTCSPIEAIFIGAFASVVYFTMSHITRNKWGLDDPLQIISIHLFCGIYSGIVEGIVANNGYGTPGLIHGNGTRASFKHFGIQLLGVIVIIIFNFILSFGLWEFFTRVIFRKTSIRVSILDIYLGTRLFDQNYDMALHEVLNCNSNSAKQMLFQFHEYIRDRYASEQFDFLLVVKIFENYLRSDRIKFDVKKSAKHIIKIIDMYVDNNGEQCINISGTQRSILMKIRTQLISESEMNKLMYDIEGNIIDNKYKSSLDVSKENVFNAVFQSVWKLVLPHFTMFCRNNFEESKKYSYNIQIPFELQADWLIVWDKEIKKCNGKNKQIKSIADTIPSYNESGTLLGRTEIVIKNNPSGNTHQKQSSGIKEIELQKNDDYYPIVFVDEKKKQEIVKNNTAVVVIE
eukprot:993501_1